MSIIRKQPPPMNRLLMVVFCDGHGRYTNRQFKPGRRTSRFTGRSTLAPVSATVDDKRGFTTPVGRAVGSAKPAGILQACPALTPEVVQAQADFAPQTGSIQRSSG